jgi:hypothetical protein
LGVASFAPVHAEETAAAPKAPAYVLKNKSTFTAPSDEQRAPFWPIGWTKRRPMQVASAAVRTVVVPKVVLDEKSFKVTSILLGNPSFAIINGRTYAEGEFLRAPKVAAAPGTTSAPAARTRVYRINDGSVVLQNQEQLITVALQRPELVQRSAVEELLSEDRP